MNAMRLNRASTLPRPVPGMKQELKKCWLSEQRKTCPIIQGFPQTAHEQRNKGPFRFILMTSQNTDFT